MSYWTQTAVTTTGINMSRLFGELVRTDLGSRYHAEPQYRYLNRSARPPVQRLRDLLEQWLNLYPEFDTLQWLERFKSEDDRHHFGAFFELYVRALLDHQGLTVDREPDVSGTRRRPEFLVCGVGHLKFMLECRLAAGPDVGSAEMKRINRLYDYLDAMESPDFFVAIERVAPGQKDLSMSRFRSSLQTQLDQLDADELEKVVESEGLDALPRWHWTDRGWGIDLFPIPKTKEARGERGVRPLGMVSTGVRKLDTPAPLLDALKKKASRYGRPDIPYVIAIDALDFFVNERSILYALFGSRKWVLGGLEVKEIRVPDGFWIGPKGPQNKRVSAVLLVIHATPGKIVTATTMLWHNPWAAIPLDLGLWQGPQMVPDQDSVQMVRQEGRTVAEILGLSPDWPGYNDDVYDVD